MTRKLTEQQVLNRLQIPDFRHLSKDVVMSFASILPDMDPEVAIKALQQFPNFAQTVLDTMRDYKSVIDKALDQGSEGAKQSYAAYKAVMDALEKALDDRELTFNEQIIILDKMSDVADKVSLKNKEHNQFIIQNLAVLGGIAVVGIGALAAALGGNAKIGEIAGNIGQKFLK